MFYAFFVGKPISSFVYFFTLTATVVHPVHLQDETCVLGCSRSTGASSVHACTKEHRSIFQSP